MVKPRRIDMHLRRMAEDAVLDVMQVTEELTPGQLRQKAAELLQARYGQQAVALSIHLDNAINALGYLKKTYEATMRVSDR